MNKKINKTFIFIIILLILIVPYKISARNHYIGDFVYYDPVNDKSCSQANYWTAFNTNTTCYRWVVIEVNSSDLRLLLDHNYFNKVQYSEISSKIAEIRTKWPNVSVSNLGTGALAGLLGFDHTKMVNYAKANPNTAVPFGDSRFVPFLVTNYYLYDKETKTNLDTSGFWISPTNSTYAPTSGYGYVMMSQFRMWTATNKAGIRPTINVSPNKIINVTYQKQQL